MKIGFDAKRAFNNKSGLGNYSRDVIRAIADQSQDEIFLFTPKQNSETFHWEKSHIIHPKEPIDIWLKSYWRSFSIVKDVRKKSLDIFHGLSNELPFTLGKSVKTVVTIHDLIFKRYPQWYNRFDRWMYNWKFESACQNADKIIAISEQTKADIISFYKINPDKIKVVYQTCNARFKTPANQELLNSVKKKYQLPDYFLLNVGTIEPRKNAFEIVKAIHQFKIDIPLIIVGRNTKYAESIKQYIQEHHLESQIRILHQVENDELPAFYQMAQLFIYPSTFEGFGIPIIEALYSGTPVITSKGSCFSEAGGANSVYVEAQNATALGSAIQQLLDDKTQQQQMSEKGLQYAQNYNTEKVTKDLYKVYEELLNAE